MDFAVSIPCVRSAFLLQVNAWSLLFYFTSISQRLTKAWIVF